MANKKFRYSHIYSSVSGKTPSADTLMVGEIAVNGFADDEKLFIKNTSGDVVDFPRSYSIKDIDEDMEIIAAALNDLNDRKQEKLIAGSGITITDDNIISAETGNKVYEVTQEEYDELVSAGTVDLEAFYIITDAQPGEGGFYTGDKKTIHINSANTVSSLIYLKKSTAGLPANVKERFYLVDSNGDNIVTASGNTSDYIDVYKDSSIIDIYLGTEWDSVDAVTGEIDKKKEGDEVVISGETHVVDEHDFKYIVYIYFCGGFSGATISGDSEYKMTKIDVAKMASEAITDPYFDSGSTNAVANSAVTLEFLALEDEIKEDMWTISASLNDLNKRKQDKLIAGSGITIDSANTISANVEGIIGSSNTIFVDNSANTVSTLIYLKKITEDLPEGVKERYQLVDANGDNIVTVSGNTSDFIDVYKDNSIVEIYVGTEWDSVDEDEGIIDKKKEGDEVVISGETHIVDSNDFQWLTYVYFAGGFSGGTVSGDGKYYMTQINLSELLIEPVFAKVVTSGKARTDIVESATTLEYYNYSGITLFQIDLPLDRELDSGSTHPVMNSAITKVILEDEQVIAAALNDLNVRKMERGDIDEDFDDESVNPLVNSAITTTLEEMQKVTSMSLNDLNDRKLDLSAYTPDNIVDETTSTSTNPVETRAVYNVLDGLKVRKVTQQEYDYMEENHSLDENTIYFIVEDA